MSDTIPRDRDAFSVITPVTLRFSDQDPLRHINNVAITALLESGRTGLFAHLFKEHGVPIGRMVLARLTVDYLKEITFPGTVDVGGRLTHVGTKSMRTEFAIFQRDTCCVVSESVNVFFDPDTRQAAQPPENVKAHLLALLAEQN